MLGRAKAQQRYERWWLNKLVKPYYLPDSTPRRVTEVEVIGPPSFVYGDVWLTYEDGSSDHVRHDGFVPAKRDMIVVAE